MIRIVVVEHKNLGGNYDIPLDVPLVVCVRLKDYVTQVYYKGNKVDTFTASKDVIDRIPNKIVDTVVDFNIDADDIIRETMRQQVDAIVNYMSKSNSISIAALEGLLGVDRSAAREAIKALVRAGIVSKYYSYWKVNKDIDIREAILSL